MRDLEVPPKYRQLYLRAMKGPGHAGSSRAATRAHCLMCCGWQQEEVRLCTAPGCPLFKFRLLSRSAKDDGADSPTGGGRETAEEATESVGATSGTPGADFGDSGGPGVDSRELMSR